MFVEQELNREAKEIHLDRLQRWNKECGKIHEKRIMSLVRCVLVRWWMNTLQELEAWQLANDEKYINITSPQWVMFALAIDDTQLRISAGPL